jgi:transposase-like protein
MSKHFTCALPSSKPRSRAGIALIREQGWMVADTAVPMSAAGMRRVASSVRLEESVEGLLAEGVGDGERLAARLVIQRSIEEELSQFLGRERYQRTGEAQGYRNGVRARRIQTAEGELEIQMPQVRDRVEPFVSKVIPDTRGVIRTRPLEVLMIGGYVRGLSDRDVESLVAEAGLGKVSRTAVGRICRELSDRYRSFRARWLIQVELLVLFLDAIYLPTRPSGAKEGVLVAWGSDRGGRRVLIDVCLGHRERHEDGWRWGGG